MQRIEVTPAGISITNRTEPLVSVFGREMRPGSTDVVTLPWDEIVNASLTTTEFPPDNIRRIELEVDVLWGDCFTVDEAAEGFTRAVQELCRLSGHPAPAASPSEPITLWPGATL